MKSMIGFGRARKEINNREYIVEIRSVNHKYNDVNIRIPRNISYFEEKIRKEILNLVTRGKIDISVTLTIIVKKEKQLELIKV